ncbi:hypothetical protein BX666DRAFT_2026788 [Dichotomocladium elegans]|nr:hypothetical protein BX666DRAFT_2026788 [Dichotomocladium elegans]
MPHQQYQPKSARIMAEDDGKSIIPLASQSTPRKTHAQELADFLNSTGPEEFQKELSTRARNIGTISSISSTTSSFFFMRRKNKSSTKHKNQEKDLPTPMPTFDSQPVKKHIEISPPPFDSYQEPILPSSKRASSLFSGSARHYHTSNSSSTYSTQPSSVAKPSHEVADIFQKNNNHIDQALRERLATFQVTSTSSPSPPPLPKPASHTQARHVQTQTEPSNMPPLLLLPSSSAKDSSNRKRNTFGPSDIYPPPSEIHNVQDLQRLIDLEKRKQKRLESAIEATCDQFEVLSGLTYIKLRTLWEEKLHWESAFYALQERCSEQH